MAQSMNRTPTVFPVFRRNRISFLVMLTLLALLVGCTDHMPGMRLLSVEIRQNDAVILRAMTDIADREPASAFWRLLGKDGMHVQDAAGIAADADQPLQATVSGTVEIQILHVDRVMTHATLPDLQLVRDRATDSDWYLPAAEMQRAEKAAVY